MLGFQAYRAPANWAPANRAPRLKPGKLGSTLSLAWFAVSPANWAPANQALANGALSNWAPAKLAPGKLGPSKLDPCIIYICIGYSLPTIWEHMSVEFIYCYWIYFANNWGICVNWRVSLQSAGGGLGNVHFLEYTYSRKHTPSLGVTIWSMINTVHVWSTAFHSNDQHCSCMNSYDQWSLRSMFIAFTYDQWS